MQVRPIHPCCEAANNGTQDRPDEGKIVNYVRQRFVSSYLGHFHISLRDRRLKGKGKGVLGARETREAREEG